MNVGGKTVPPRVLQYLAGSTWFHKEFGFNEEAVLQAGFDAVKRQFVLREHDGEVELESISNSRKFHVGGFETPSVATLRRHLASGEPARTEPDFGSGSRVGTRLTFQNIEEGARGIHLYPANDGAVIQVASQANCLEMVDTDVQPENGITMYQDDETQGPACAMACPAATVFRNYFAPVAWLQSEGIREWTGQAGGSERQIDTTSEVSALLENFTHQYWQMQNGYLVPIREDALAELAERINQEELADGEPLREEITSRTRVGVQWSTESTCIRQSNEADDLRNPSQRVTQVLCSALPVAYDPFQSKKADWEPFARAVLDAQYEATLTVAAILALSRGARVKVFLTSVGGGAFKNERHWIDDAVERALDRHMQSPLDVFLVHFKMNKHNKVASKYPPSILPIPALPVDPGPIREAMIFLSRAQQPIINKDPVLRDLQLPCWVPHRMIAAALKKPMSGIERAEGFVGGPYLWATEFENVHDMWSYEEPEVYDDNGVKHRCSEEFYHSQKPRPFDAIAWRGAPQVAAMDRAVRAKLKADPELRTLLLATHNYPLVSIKGDEVWGFDPVHGGKNLLAEVWVKIRSELQNGAAL